MNTTAPPQNTPDASASVAPSIQEEDETATADALTPSNAVTLDAPAPAEVATADALEPAHAAILDDVAAADPSAHATPRDLAPLLAGAAAVGLCLGLGDGPAALTRHVVGLPAIFIGVALFTLPALYILTAIAGATPTRERLLAAALQSLRETGQVMLGFTPALLLLITSSTATWAQHLFGALCVASAVLLGQHALLDHLQADPDSPARAPAFRGLFASWSVVSLGIGFHLFSDLIL